ncbi:MAG: hypothetical protein ACHQ6T_14435, partial [Myxococcota bacterium]
PPAAAMPPDGAAPAAPAASDEGMASGPDDAVMPNFDQPMPEAPGDSAAPPAPDEHAPAPVKD